MQKEQFIQVRQKILVYPAQAQQLRKKFLQRNTIQQFKNISDKQILTQYKILDSADFYNQKQTFYLKKTNKNRYIDILTYNHSRVKCKSSQNYYVNASEMRSIIDGKQFAIFSQAPTPQAFQQFWEALYEKNVKLIVMLCSFHDPRRGIQSEKYWAEVGQQIMINHINLNVKTTNQQKISNDLVITHFTLNGLEGEKVIKHIHWTGWADLKKPLGQENQKIFKNLVNQCLGCIDRNELFLVHCSAGIGRTGTLGTVIQAIRCAKQWKKLSVFEIVENLRKNRMNCVQTFEQYNYVYQELKKYFCQK